jgi:hypothetical protein
MHLLRLLILLCLSAGLSVSGWAGQYELTNGDIVRGEPVSFNDDGMIVRLDIGGYSPLISWSKLTQDSLKDLVTNPKAANFVEPFIDTPPVQKDKEKKKKDIVLKPVPRVPVVEKPSFFASLGTPAGLGIFGLLYLANVYAAFEVARFRHRPPALVCGVSLLFPFVGPGLFLALPGEPEPEIEGGGVAEPAAATLAAGKATTGPMSKAPVASGLSISHQEKAGGGAAAAGPGPQSYKRGEFTFNRRFFETKFPGFFRVIPNADGEVLVVRTAKVEHVAKRISRITSNEMHLQLLRGTEIAVPFAEMTEVQVRHQEAKAT